MTMVWGGGALVAIVFEGDKGARGRTVDDREPSLGHLGRMIAVVRQPIRP
jgi:hypothetical protein